MKEKFYKVLTGIMLCLLVNFVFSNTVFIHSHLCVDGHTITHSHPYLPGSHHSHSGASLDQIAVFNLSAASMEAGGFFNLIVAPIDFMSVEIQRTIVLGWVMVSEAALRAPPVEM